MLKNTKIFLKKNKEIIKYILVLFFISRTILTIVGVTSRVYFDSLYPKFHVWKYSNNLFLDIWGIWDSGYYLDIAKRGYTESQKFEFSVSIPKNSYGAHQNNYGFLPLYSVFIKLTSLIFKDYYLSSLIVSNISFLASALILFKLLEKLKDKTVAKRAIKYLFLFPSSFIYSGAFTESLALLGAVAAFYLLEKKRYFASGIASAGAVLTKISGLFITIPIFLSLLKDRSKKTLSWLSIFLPAVGLCAFLIFQYFHSGNPFIYFDTKKLGWDVTSSNPFEMLYRFLFFKNIPYPALGVYLVDVFIIIEILLIIYSYRKIEISYFLFWVLGFLMLFINGIHVAWGVPRQSLFFFPQYLSLALITKSKRIDFVISAIFIYLQLFSMAIWVNAIIVM